MDTARSETSGWDCPSCGRRVPGRVRACRCGFEQSGAADAVETSTPASRPWAAGLPLLGIGLVMGAALALYPWRQPPAGETIAPVQAKPVATTAVHVPHAAEPQPIDAEDPPAPEPERAPEPTKVTPPEPPPLAELASRVVPAA